MVLRTLMAGTTFAMGALALSAAVPERALSEYQKQVWQVEDGLPQDNVRTIVQDPNGQLLLGTGGGMALFDGLRFTSLKVDAKDPAANQPVNALLFAHNGDLWIGTDDRGVIHRSLRGSVNVSEAVGLNHERVRALAEDRQGVIWAATQNCVERIAGDRIECLTALGIVPGDITQPFAVSQAGEMFVVTVKGLFVWSAGHARAVALEHRRLGEPTSVYCDPHGQMWVGARGGILKLKQEGGVFRAEVVPGGHGPVVALLMDHNYLWVGSRSHGICRLSSRGFAHWTSAEGLPDDTIHSMFLDNEGNLWIGMLSGGLSRWNQAPLIPFGAPEGLPKAFASTVLADGSGTIWLGTWGKGIYRLRDRAIEHFTLPGISNDVPIRALGDDRKGGIWIGTWYGGLCHWDGRSARRYLTGAESPSNAVSALLIDRSGTLWVGTYAGLLKYEKGFPAPGKAQTLLPGHLISCLREGPSGEILVGTTEGLYRLDGSFISEVAKDALPSPSVISLSVDGVGGVWVGTKAGGLDKIEGMKAIHVASNSGIPAIPIHSLIEDGHGMLWMGSARGVVRVPRTQLYELVAGRRRTVDVLLLGKSDGMRSSECGGLSQPSAAFVGPGNLWFATANGFVHTNPDWSLRTLEPPRPRIVGFTVDRVEQGPSQELTVAPGSVDVGIGFDATRLSHPSLLQFRYKLENYDADWTLTHSRHTGYKRLPPGKFRFLLDVREGLGPWGGRLAEVTVEQQPYIYQQGWFYAALCALLAAAMMVVFRGKIARARARMTLILAERNRIAREWHDTLMADFAAISWQLEATQHSLDSASGHSAASKSLDVARTMVKHCQAEARRIIWDLRGGDEPLGLLSQELAKTISIVGPRAESSAELSVEGEERPLPAVFLHHLVSIGREAVINALNHGSPGAVKVQIKYSGNRVTLVVSDNGAGFRPSESPHATPGHFGLAVMHERAKKMGGHLVIQSTPGLGTEIVANVPMPAERKSA